MTVFLNLSYNLPNEGVVLNDINFKNGNFRKRISDITGVQEGEVISSEQIARIRELNLSNSGIENLDGIQFFTALEMLDCYDNNITELDLRNNINLTEVDFGDNFISEFKLPSNIKIIHCKDNLFTELNLSQYSQLTTLDCSKNKDLVLIDVSQNTALKNLYASETKIKENNGINLVNNTELRKLVLDKNNLTNISLGTNTALETLSLSENELTEINLNANTALLSLYLDKNKLSNIDLSANTALTEIYLSNNKLKNLDLSTNKELSRISSSGTEGKILVNDNFDFEYDDVENYFHTEISFDLKNKDYIDLNEEYGITKDEIDNNRVILDSEEVKLNNLYFDGTKLKWNGKTPDFISYQYKCGGRKDKINLGVFLHLENGNPDKPNPNPNPGGGSGGGTTTPDQKPDQKPDEKPNKPNKPGNITSKIVGKNRYETAAKIADELVKNNVSYNSVILVNSDKSMADGLSAASLSGKKNAPILLVKKDSIPAEAMAKIEKAKNVYIIGGEGAISKKVENQLKGKNITRISGKDRYETSAKIANMLGGYKMAFIVNGAKGEADAMSVSSVAAKYGAPILLTNGKTSTHPVKAGVSYFVIGGRGVVSNQLADKYNADRIAGVDRYSTNRKVIDEFYYDSKKVYFAKGDTLVDALTASLLAKDNGMVLVSKNANHKKLEGKEAVQVGGMDFEISFE